jgi:hypothetical protein
VTADKLKAAGPQARKGSGHADSVGFFQMRAPSATPSATKGKKGSSTVDSNTFDCSELVQWSACR